MAARGRSRLDEDAVGGGGVAIVGVGHQEAERLARQGVAGVPIVGGRAARGAGREGVRGGCSARLPREAGRARRGRPRVGAWRSWGRRAHKIGELAGSAPASERDATKPWGAASAPPADWGRWDEPWGKTVPAWAPAFGQQRGGGRAGGGGGVGVGTRGGSARAGPARGAGRRRAAARAQKACPKAAGGPKAWVLTGGQQHERQQGSGPDGTQRSHGAACMARRW